MRVWLVASCTLVLAVTSPRPAAAQHKEAFAKAMFELTLAQVGSNGDEGPQITAAIDAMARALEAWERDVRNLETQVAAAGGSVPRQTLARMRTALGLTYYEWGRTRDARREFEAASQEEPRDALPHLLRARLLYDGGATDAALRAFQRAFDLDRGDPAKAYWVVRSAFDAGKPDEAQDAIDRLAAAYRATADRTRPTVFYSRSFFRDDASSEPLFPLQSYRQGFALIAGGEFRRALDALREAADADPLVTDPALRSDETRRGASELKEGRAAAAIGHFERAVALGPRSSEAHRLLGAALRRAGRLQESLAQMESAIRLDPGNERAHVSLVSALLELADRDPGALPRARRALDEALTACPESGMLRWMAASFHRGKDDEEALRHLLVAETSNPITGMRRILAEKGRLLSESREIEQTFQRAVIVNPNDPLAHLDLGEFYRAQGLAIPAMASFVAAALVAPETVEAHTALGQVYLSMDRTGDAAAAFERTLALRPEQADAHYGLASALRRLGRTDEADAELARFRRLQRAAIEDTRRQMEESRLARETALRNEVAAAQAMVEREPDNPAHRLRLGEALVREGRSDLAVAQLEQAAALGAPPVVYLRLAEVYAALGRTDESVSARMEYERRGGVVAAVRRTDTASPP